VAHHHHHNNHHHQYAHHHHGWNRGGWGNGGWGNGYYGGTWWGNPGSSNYWYGSNGQPYNFSYYANYPELLKWYTQSPSTTYLQQQTTNPVPATNGTAKTSKAQTNGKTSRSTDHAAKTATN